MSLCDRIRGGLIPIKHFSHVGTLLMGWLIAYSCGYPLHWTTLVCVGLWYGFERFGWGWAVSRVLNKQWAEKFRPEKDSINVGNHWWTLTVRGLVWGLPVSLLGFYDPHYFIALSMGICMPSAAWIARENFNSDWGAMEYVRGALFGLFLVMGGAV